MAGGVSVEDVMGAIKAAVEMQGAELSKKLKGTVVYDIGGKKWTVTLKDGVGAFHDGGADKADLTVSMDAATFLALAAGKANAQSAFMQGKLKLKGNMAMAMKLQTVMDAARKAGDVVPASASTAAAAPAAPAGKGAAAAPAGAATKSKPFFEAIAAAVKADGASLVQKVKGRIAFVLTQGSPAGPTLAQYCLDLKTGAGSLAEGAPKEPVDLTLTVTDDDFVGLATGKLNSQSVRLRPTILLLLLLPAALRLRLAFWLPPSLPGYRPDCQCAPLPAPSRPVLCRRSCRAS